MTRRACLVTLAPIITGCGTRGEITRSRVRVTATLGARLHLIPERLDYFNKEGIAVQTEEVASSAKVVQALVGGSTDIALVSLDLVLQLAAEGKQLRMFVTGALLPNHRFYSASGSRRFIRSVSDLRGAVIGIPGFGSTAHWEIAALLDQHGLTVSDVKLIAIGSNPALFAALETGKVDAAMLSSYFTRQYEHKYPGAAVLLDMHSIDGAKRTFGVGSYPTGFAARTDWLDQNGNTARHLARALQAGLRWINEHTPEQIRESYLSINVQQIHRWISMPSE
jgi:NitT/TauT family transport system substrate-binding protein